jgi:excisionase family DNA binding protein
VLSSTANDSVTSVRAMRVPDACRALGISKSALYREIAADRLQAKKAGSITLIPIEALNAWLASLPTKAQAAKAA